MLSASHNPMPDNGIKFLARGGHKLDDAVEIAIERRMRRGVGAADRWRRRPRRAPTTTAVEEYVAHLVRTIDAPARRAQGRRSTAPRVRRTTAGPRALARRRRRRSSPSTPTPTASTSTTAAARPTWSRCRPRCSSTAPTSASPSTATPTAAWRSTTRATSSTATRSWRSSRCRMREQGRLAKDTVVATVMSNLGFVQAMRAARRRRTPDQGRRPLRARGDEGLRLLPRRRAVGPRHHERPRHHRRRHPHRPPRAGADGHHRPVAGRRSPR